MVLGENLKLSKNGIAFKDKHGQELSSEEAANKIIVRVFNWYLDTKLFFLHIVSLHVPLYTIRKIFLQMAGVKIGKGSTVHMGCKFFKPDGVEIGEDTVIGDRCFLDGRAELKIGNHVDVASEVMIYNSEHDLKSPTFSAINESVTIGDYVFIGPRAIILPGVRVGKGAVVAAGAVVTKDVKDKEIVGGVPAKLINKREIGSLNYKLGRSRLFQ